jgi:drug/metabolite transporter (DMT)-like permease
MSLIAVFLILVSAFMHAGWNLFCKKSYPTDAFFLVACLAGASLLSPVLIIWHEALLHEIPGRVWMLISMAGFFMALYYIALAGAYRAGELSIAYPLARSSPVIVVLVVTRLSRG